MDIEWQLIPMSGSVTSIDAFPDNSIIGIGSDNQLRIRETPISDWVNLPADKGMLCVAVMPDGSLLGIGSDDNQLYTRKKLYGKWNATPKSKEIIDLTYCFDNVKGKNNKEETRPSPEGRVSSLFWIPRRSNVKISGLFS